jgi:hypothetical protein
MMYGKVKHGHELPQAKLNETLVKRIRQEHAEKEAQKRKLENQFSVRAMAVRYGVSKPTIEKVLSYATWRHVA